MLAAMTNGAQCDRTDTAPLFKGLLGAVKDIIEMLRILDSSLGGDRDWESRVDAHLRNWAARTIQLAYRAARARRQHRAGPGAGAR
jgi:hypothetical protein